MLSAFDTSSLTGVFLVLLVEKNLPANGGDLGSIPELGRYPGEGKGYPLQYSGLENSMDFIVHGVAKSWTRLSDFHFTPQNSTHYSSKPVSMFLVSM